MLRLGYKLSSEEFGPADLVRQAARAEEAGFDFALSLFTEIAQPQHFEAAFKPITEAQVAEAVVCGPDPARYLAAIRQASRAGYDHVCLHQIGPDQEGFIRFCETQILPRPGRTGAAPRRTLARRRAA